MPWEALHSTAGEGYIVPSQGKNVAGGKEFLRAMLSKEAAVELRQDEAAPRPSSRAQSPRTGSGRPRWCRRSSCSSDAGSNIFSWNFVDLYGMNTDQLVVWNTFLQGGSSVAELTKGLQAITDKVAKDDSIKKVEVK